MRAQQVTDRPAERGIGITNVLLAFLILVSSGFGTMIITSMGNMEKSINSLNVSMGKTDTELSHIHEQQKECKLIHMEIKNELVKTNERLTKLENI